MRHPWGRACWFDSRYGWNVSRSDSMKTSSMTPGTFESMSGRDFEEIRNMSYQHCGINLKGKEVLVSARLSNQIRKMGLTSFREYCDQVKSDSSGQMMTAMI